MAAATATVFSNEVASNRVLDRLPPCLLSANELGRFPHLSHGLVCASTVLSLVGWRFYLWQPRSKGSSSRRPSAPASTARRCPSWQTQERRAHRWRSFAGASW